MHRSLPNLHEVVSVLLFQASAGITIQENDCHWSPAPATAPTAMRSCNDTRPQVEPTPTSSSPVHSLTTVSDPMTAPQTFYNRPNNEEIHSLVDKAYCTYARNKRESDRRHQGRHPMMNACMYIFRASISPVQRGKHTHIATRWGARGVRWWEVEMVVVECRDNDDGGGLGHRRSRGRRNTAPFVTSFPPSG